MNLMLERALQEGTPLIDDETVTFVWQGEEPLAGVGEIVGAAGRS
jgi:sulfatase maturation enzyme AslB (radical SAM superfamily)